MADSESNHKNEKGFAGLNSLVSDISASTKQTSPSAPPKVPAPGPVTSPAPLQQVSTNGKEQSMKNWYQFMPKGQKIFVYLVSIALILLYGIGLLPLVILIYLELGQRGNA